MALPDIPNNIEETNPGRNYELWNVGFLPESERNDFRKVATNLVGYASLAASSHNTQPWQFIVDTEDRTIMGQIDPSLVLPASDKSSRQAFISLGCSLGNLEAAISAYGLPFNSSIDSTSGVVSVKIGDKVKEDSPEILDVIKRRRVNRSECEVGRGLPEEVISDFNACVSQEAGLQLRMISDRPTRLIIAEFQEKADRFVMAMPTFSRELGDWLLPNDTDSFVGMPGKTFGLQDTQSRETHEELKAGKVTYETASGVAMSDHKRIESCAALGIILADGDSREDQIRTGRAWQKMALVAERNNISMAVHAAMVEVSLVQQVFLKPRLGTSRRPLMIFTVGYAKGYSGEMPPHSPRKPVDQILSFR